MTCGVVVAEQRKGFIPYAYQLADAGLLIERWMAK
jgi:hypothetical protein